MEAKKISVIVPMYNAQQTIERCLRSLQSQTHRQMEIIIVDDGSTDNSVQIVERLAEGDNRIQLVRIKNSGPGIARNKGLEMISGDYFCFVDGDDYVVLEYLSAMLSDALEHQADIVQCGYYRVKEDGTIKRFPIRQSDILLSSRDCLAAFSRQEKIDNFPWGKLFRSERFKQIRFPALYKSEDKVYLFKALKLCNRLYLSERKLYYYVETDNSLSRSRFSMRDFDELHAGRKIYQLCQSGHQELAREWASYIASRSALLYCKLYREEHPRKTELMKEVSELFNIYYYESHRSLSSRNKTRALFLRSFHLSKRLTARIYENLFLL